ncbi:MAG: SDR family oxidoreductase [Alloprevotella sp.]|nr:SDR family oxidoreductase [Alloprevotella sp.]
MKNAIVTGGTKGIGLSIAQMLLREGYFVTATYGHDAASAEQARGMLAEVSPHFEIVFANQSDKQSMASLAASMRQREHIDCLVCNAGATLRKDWLQMTDEEWEDVLQVNLNSYVFLLRDLFPLIPSGSRIILIGSQMGIHPHAASLAYGVTKSAVHALAQNLVKCFDGTETTVNAIAPGFVETDWQQQKPQQIRENICAKTALHRFARPEEVADTVRFCINNPFVNGSIIEVHGGYSYR